MSNFIGIKPNQVPTNSDLGRLAFLDYVGLEDIGVAIPTIASDTKIYPTTAITYISGTTTINTIVPPPSFINGGQIVLIPTGLFTISTSDNVTVAVTAEVSKAIILIYNAANNRWYPSYSKTGGGGAGGLTATGFKTANYTASAGELVRCNTVASPISVTLPSSPSDGDVVGVIDIYNTFYTNPVSVLPNGKTVEGDTSSFILDVSGSYATFIYNSTTSNWKIQNTPTVTSPSAGLIPTPIRTANYTVAPSELVRCDSTLSSFNVTLPLLPADGSIIGIIDIYSTFNTNNLTVLPNTGATIEGDSSLILDINGSYLTLVYVAANTNWRLMSIPIGVLGNVSTNDTLAGLVKGTGTTLTNAVAGTDYLIPGGALGTPSSGTLTNCTFPTLNQDTTGTAAKATNLAGGAAGNIHYQSGVNTTAFVTNGTSGQILTSNGSSAPSWVSASTLSVSSATTAAGLSATLVVGSGGTGVTTISGIIKGNGTSAFSAASAGTDYLAPPSGTSILKANNGGALAAASAGTDYVAPGTATSFTKPQTPSISSDTAPVSNTVTWDLTTNQIFRINLSDNITTFNLTGTLSSLVGNQYQLVIRYNGGSTISWNSNMKWTAATAPTLTGTSDKLDVITFVVMSTDGTNYYLVNTGLKLNVG